MIPKLATIQNLLNNQKAKGVTPKCSLFHLLPHRITMDIIKLELDRQKAERDTLDYWTNPIEAVWFDNEFADQLKTYIACGRGGEFGCRPFFLKD